MWRQFGLVVWFGICELCCDIAICFWRITCLMERLNGKFYDKQAFSLAEVLDVPIYFWGQLALGEEFLLSLWIDWFGEVFFYWFWGGRPTRNVILCVLKIMFVITAVFALRNFHVCYEGSWLRETILWKYALMVIWPSAGKCIFVNILEMKEKCKGKLIASL